ncbi:transmembrane ascorbate ferrireductase 1, partial [Tanacetum coccineum]
MGLAINAVHLSYVVHVLGVAGAVMVLFWNIYFRGGLAWSSSTNKNLIFNVHPVLMLIGLVIMGGEALVLGIIGIYMAFKNHNESGIAKPKRFNYWMIGVIVLYGVQWIYGFLVFFYPGGSGELRKESVPWHVLFGMFIYILVVANSALGFLEKLTFLESFNAKNVEVATECVPEAPVAVEKEDEKLALVPVEPCVDEEKPAEEKHGDDTKALVVVEKPTEACDEKPKEGSINRDDVLAKVANEKKEALIKAWEESEKSKAEN